MAACGTGEDVDPSAASLVAESTTSLVSLGSERIESAAGDSASGDSASGDSASGDSASGDSGDKGQDSITTTTTRTTTTEAPPPTPETSDGQSLLLFAYGTAGGWSGDDWTSGDWDEDLGTLAEWTGREATVLTIDGVQGVASIGEPGEICEPIGLNGLPTQPALEYSNGYPEIGIVAHWDPVPRQWDMLEAPPDIYLDEVGALIQGRGIDPAGAVLDQVIRVDLEGDGIDEILISANDNWDFAVVPSEDTYSVVILRKVVDGDVRSAILHFEVADPGEESFFFLRMRLAGFADLNGDGKLEILTQEEYYEGSSVTAWEYTNDDLGPSEVLITGCGA